MNGIIRILYWYFCIIGAALMLAAWPLTLVIVAVLVFLACLCRVAGMKV